MNEWSEQAVEGAEVVRTFLRSFATNPTPSPSAFTAKPSHETNTSTDHPTNKQGHSSSAETSHGNRSHDSTDATASPTSTSFSTSTIPNDRYADSEPYQANWVDYRPNLVEVEVSRNAEGDMVGQWGGEEVIFPDLDTSLDWVLSTPVDVHLFEEVPIIKECPEEH